MKILFCVARLFRLNTDKTHISIFSRRQLIWSTLLGATLISALPSHAKDRWVQIHADINYSRTYAFEKKDPRYHEVTQFTLTLKAATDQMMWRMDPDGGQQYPSYILLDDIESPFKNSGTATLEASLLSDDHVAKRKDTASAKLNGVIKRWDDFYIEKIAPESSVSVALSSILKLNPALTGAVTNTMISLTETPIEDTLFHWATPVVFDKDEKKYLAKILINSMTPLGPRPKDDYMARMHDLVVASLDISNLAQVGGAVVGSRTAKVVGSTDAWIYTDTVTRDVEVTSDRGNYKETLSITIKPVNTTLAVPRNPDN